MRMACKARVAVGLWMNWLRGGCLQSGPRIELHSQSSFHVDTHWIPIHEGLCQQLFKLEEAALLFSHHLSPNSKAQIQVVRVQDRVTSDVSQAKHFQLQQKVIGGKITGRNLPSERAHRRCQNFFFGTQASMMMLEPRKLLPLRFSACAAAWDDL